MRTFQLRPHDPKGKRSPSKKTRIETRKNSVRTLWSCISSGKRSPSKKTRIETSLKLLTDSKTFITRKRSPSKKTRIETHAYPTRQTAAGGKRSPSKKTRIETTWYEYGYAAVDVFVCGNGKRSPSKKTRIETHQQPKGMLFWV